MTPQARYAREQHGGEMVLTFTVRRGPLHTLAATEIVGNQALTDAELAPLMQLKTGEPFVGHARGDCRLGDHRALSRARIRTRQRQAGHQ